LIARTAAINSVALPLIYEYHFHALGTNKCHIPKPTEAMLPIITKTLTSRFKVIPPVIIDCTQKDANGNIGARATTFRNPIIPAHHKAFSSPDIEYALGSLFLVVYP